MNDILFYSPSLQLHAQHLQQVHRVLRQQQFYVKLAKCEFAQQELDYLGHIISRAGVATDPKKTSTMRAWPVPTTTTELRGFLGLTGYYRKFVKYYGAIARPLNNLLKKKQFGWNAEVQAAFEKLKLAMSTTPVLALPDFSKPFVVETDASDLGFGVVLMQEERPVAYISKSLSNLNKSLSIYEKEFMALILAMDKWRQYLQRQEFVIKTDHKSLAYLNDQTL
jgi:hypothetical protein